MVFLVKEGRRKRYIGFLVNSNSVVEKSDMIKTLNYNCKNLYNKDCKEMGIYLTRFDGTKGIVRCNHVEKDNVINLLKSIKNLSNENVVIDTLGTSGTIKALVRKHM